MNAKLIILGMTAMLPVALWGQSPVDAYNLSQTELRGTARFMSMAGAFTALGVICRLSTKILPVSACTAAAMWVLRLTST